MEAASQLGRQNLTYNEEHLIRRGAALTDKMPLDGAASLEDSACVYGVSIDEGGVGVSTPASLVSALSGQQRTSGTHDGG